MEGRSRLGPPHSQEWGVELTSCLLRMRMAPLYLAINGAVREAVRETCGSVVSD